MFSKKKRYFPHGTFIATPARITAILQLCFAFSVIAWDAGQPFMGELFALKSKIYLHQTVMGTYSQFSGGDPLENEELQTKLARNAQRFAELSHEEKDPILQSHQKLQNRINIPFPKKLNESFKILVCHIRPFEQAWLAFSIVISILLLMRIDGAWQAAWLLPLICLFYAVDNSANGKKPILTEEARLFPSEEVLLKDYVKEPLEVGILEQQKQLRRGWRLFLVKEWALEEPSQDPKKFIEQVEKGEFQFNLERLKKNPLHSSEGVLFTLHKQQPLFVLLLYLSWNLFFAWFVNRKKYHPDLQLAY